ncbi:hypothetical protein P7H15_10985 [Paenibacillus larvae]|nr:hypothetical protein [Paenibacillus larvae]MDT2293261.1 hypothetical protein [Paenibacillus larvae]
MKPKLLDLFLAKQAVVRQVTLVLVLEVIGVDIELSQTIHMNSFGQMRLRY